ncbi:DUF6318 family protein [Actinomyces wuliandei]|uniref:DUF6318 family protein n=1 Tax=Actinomyces wuliandei TaxID=2057743 RepID=UPI000FD76597|nr:DUF6318 family protein [Actinomyces wuliandei]
MSLDSQHPRHAPGASPTSGSRRPGWCGRRGRHAPNSRALLLAAVGVLVGLLAATACGLAGCSRAGGSTGASGSASSAPSSSTVSPTPSPTLSLPPLPPQQEASRQTALGTPPPDRPAGMDEESPEGAIATAEYLLSLIPYISATGDLSLWQEHTEDSGCVFCQSVIDDASSLHAQGGWEEPWSPMVTDSGYADPEQGYHYSRVDLLFDHDAVSRYDGSGSDPHIYEAQSEKMMTFALIYRDGQWLLGEAEVYEEDP